MLLAITLMVLVQQPQAATRPPIGGVWVAETERLQIALKGNSLTVTRGSLAPMTYALDGSVSRNNSKTAANADWKHESMARWVGNAILIVTRTTRETGASWEWLAVYSIDAESGGLIVLTVDYAATEAAAEGGMLTRSRTYRRAPGSAPWVVGQFGPGS
jgi:hypothetical protein